MIEFLASVIKFSTVFLFGATGEIITKNQAILIWAPLVLFSLVV